MKYRQLAVAALAVVMQQSLVASRADAIEMELTPVVAHLTPLNSQVTDNDDPLVIRQASSTAYGARLGAWFHPRIGAEASVLVGSSHIQLVGAEALNLDAYMLQMDLRARVRLNDPSANVGLDAIAGIGLSNIGDPLSDLGDEIGLKSPATFEFVLGIGGTISVTDKVQLRFDIEDHIHDSNYELDETLLGYTVENRKQNDIVVAMGLVIPVF